MGIRVRASGKLVAFISAVPAQMKLKAATVAMVDINYLCVHKKLRSKRLAPVLIKVLHSRICERTCRPCYAMHFWPTGVNGRQASRPGRPH